jgi:hypothetical protein
MKSMFAVSSSLNSRPKTITFEPRGIKHFGNGSAKTTCSTNGQYHENFDYSDPESGILVKEFIA